MRILFAASPSIAVPCLEALCNIDGIELAGVLTNPDSAKGRHGTPVPTDVGEAAQKAGVSPVLKPLKLDADAREQVNSIKPDLLVSFAYGRIFGPKFLALFPYGGINIHPSLLPKYRGPSPVQAAILNGDTETGITIQTLAQETDCGDILTSERLQLTGRETALSLSDTVSKKAAEMLSDLLKKMNAAGKEAFYASQLKAQNHGEASYCRLFSAEDSFIDWNKSAREIDAAVRAFFPWPLCRTIHKGRELIILKADVYTLHGDRVHSVPMQGRPGLVLGTDNTYGILIQTGEGILAVTELQYQARKALFWRDFSGSQLD